MICLLGAINNIHLDVDHVCFPCHASCLTIFYNIITIEMLQYLLYHRVCLFYYMSGFMHILHFQHFFSLSQSGLCSEQIKKQEFKFVNFVIPIKIYLDICKFLFMVPINVNVYITIAMCISMLMFQVVYWRFIGLTIPTREAGRHICVLFSLYF